MTSEEAKKLGKIKKWKTRYNEKLLKEKGENFNTDKRQDKDHSDKPLSDK